jgi:hypothetical protein
MQDGPYRHHVDTNFSKKTNESRLYYYDGDDDDNNNNNNNAMRTAQRRMLYSFHFTTNDVTSFRLTFNHTSR